MAADNNGMTDEIEVELNPDENAEEPVTEDIPSLPDRPSTKAPREEWVEYVVALGADEHWVNNETEHFDGASEETVTEPELSQEELVDLADQLGG